VIDGDHATVSNLSIAGCAWGVSLAWPSSCSVARGNDGCINASNVLVQNNFFRDIRMPLESYTPSAGSWGHAVSLSNGATDSTRVANLTIRNNFALRVDVFYEGGGGALVEGLTLAANTVEKCGGNCYSMGHFQDLLLTDSVFLRDIPDRFFIYGTTDIIFGGASGVNVVQNTDFNRRGETEGGPDGCAIDFETSASGVLIANCTFYHSYGSGIMVFGHSSTSHNISISDNTFDHAGCFQTRNDHAGIAIMCPGGNKPSATIAGNTFTTCPNTPAIWSNPVVEGCNASVKFSGNNIDTVGIVAMPNITIAPTLATQRALPFTAQCDTPNATIRYTLDGSRPSESSPILPDGTPLLLSWPSQALGVNVRAFKDGMRPSVTNGKIIELDRSFPLPQDGMRGSLDGFFAPNNKSTTRSCLLGWAVDPTLPGGGVPAVNMSIFIDNALDPLATVLASVSREDLVKAKVAPNPEHGLVYCFSDAEWQAISSGQHTVAVDAVGSPLTTPRGWQLPNSPLCLLHGTVVPC
jgi:hypothetical protein